LAGGSPFKREVRIKMGKKKIIRDLEPESWICKICRTKIGVNNVFIIFTTSTKIRRKEHQEQISEDKAAKKKDRYRPIRHAG
jgi:hypothetical protein